MKKINVGIIGSGFIVPFFIEACNEVKGYHYRGIAAHNEARLAELKDKYKIDYYSLNNDEVLSDPLIDAIYVAVPNHLHYEIARKALQNDKHVIMEKPFTPTYKECKELIDLAKKKKKIIFDAVTLLHTPNYKKMKELLPLLGDIKMLDLNFSQYSSRYDKFINGITLPAFDYRKAGGALMDLGIYNINYAVGLFGEPKKVAYYPNVRKKADTSGVLVLDYGSFKVNSVAAKDCKAPAKVCIQGDKGYILSNEPSSIIAHFQITDNKGKTKEYALNKKVNVTHYHEYAEFRRLVNEEDFAKAEEYNELTLKTIRVLEKALKDGNIVFKY